MHDSDTFVDLASERRRKNARTLSLALTVLGGAGVVASELAGGPRIASVATWVQTLFCLIAYLVLRKGHFIGGVVLMILGPLIQHVTIVASMGKLTVLPFISTLAVLLAAATLPLKRLYIGISLALLAILVEGSLVDLGAKETILASGTLAGSLLYLGVVAVISVLHVHGTERAAALAREREAARERAAAAARASEDRYRLIAENTIDLIALLDAHGRPTYLSPSHERVLGCPTNALLGQPFAELVSSDDRSRMERYIAGALASGRAHGELTFVGRSGAELLFDSTFTHLRTDAGDLVAVLSRNITERRAMEENLRRAGRMEALGRMARGVAHDFNNLLTALVGNAELAELALPREHPAYANLRSIREVADSASRLTQQLLAFSRSQTRLMLEIQPTVELAKLTPLLLSVVGKGVTLVVDAEEDCPSLHLNGGHFEQLLLNLAANASQAMQASGTLHIGLARRRLADHEVAELKAGDYVELSVTDSGVGIAPDVLPHLFEPFYTTRAESGGTGLGLATCYGIATQHGGQIVVDSAVGRGTTFRVLLPVAAPAQEGTPSPTRAPADTTGAREALAQGRNEPLRILLVDDETAIRDITSSMLAADGHEVHEAGTFAAAKAAVEDLRQTFDVILTDIVLEPGLGTDLLEVARAVRPRIRCCAMSGFLPSRDIEAALRGMNATFLAKPFERASLLAAVRGR